jgi:uncharacterized protein YbaR (Trm112 family)
MSVNIENLIKVIVCPITKTKLTYNRENNELISRKAGLIFPIIDDVPILIIEEAKKIKIVSKK